MPTNPMNQGFQACTPRVVSLGFGMLLRDPRGLYEGYVKAICWKPLRVRPSGYEPGTFELRPIIGTQD